MAGAARLGGTGSLVQAALASDEAVSWWVWLMTAPLVVVDAVCLEPLVSEDPQLRVAMEYLGIATALFLISSVWMVVGRLVHRRLPSSGPRIALSLAMYALIGATWGGASIRVLTTADPTVDVPVTPMESLVSGTLIQLIVGTLLALVLWSRATSIRSEDAVAAQKAQMEGTRHMLAQVRLAARQDLAGWSARVFVPTTTLLLERIAELQEERSAYGQIRRSEVDRVIAEVDSFRESVVRSSSRRLHPRIQLLGLETSLRSVVNGHSGLRVTMDLGPSVSDVDAQVSALLTRSVDVMLSMIGTFQPDARVSVAVEVGESDVRLDVVGGRLIDAAGSIGVNEIESRVLAIGGLVTLEDDGTGRAHLHCVINPEPAQGHLAVAAPRTIPVPTLAAIATAIPTAIVVSVLDGRLLSTLIVTTAALSVGPLTALALRLRPGIVSATHRAERVVVTAVVSGAVSVVMTAAWMVLGAPAHGLQDLIAFWIGNALVVASVIALALLLRQGVESRTRNLAAAEATVERMRADCRVLADEIDIWRESVAQLLHSRVQARLVVSAGRLEEARSGVAGSLIQAALAIRLIRDIDAPAIRSLLSGENRPESVSRVLEVICESAGVRLSINDPLLGSRITSSAVNVIIQESITNAVRHGHATRVNVAVTRDGGGIDVVVADDGCPPPAVPRMGLGLAVIDAVTDGQWSLGGSAMGGTELRARTIGGP